MDILSTFILVAGISGTIITYYLWKKYKDVSQFYYFLICATGLIALGWEYYSNNIFHLSGQTVVIDKYTVIAFWIIEFILFVLVTVKDRKKNK